MRRIMAFDHVSADGFFSTRDGKLDWVVPDDALDERAVEGMKHSDTILFGRKTYDMFESFWPNALKDPSDPKDPHDPRRRAPTLRAMAKWINDATKLVFSRTRKDVGWKNSHVLGDFDPHKIEALKRAAGKHILIFGSGSIVSQLARHGLIDEVQLAVSPVLLGSGRSLLDGFAKPVRLELLGSESFPSGDVLLRYSPAK
jgi:dihydrofolate reductase